MNYRINIWLVLVLLFAAASPSIASADTPPFTGSYTLDEAASDDMHEAFEPALQEMNRVKRTLARRHLRQNVAPDQHTTIRLSEDSVIIDSGDRPTLNSKLDGQPTSHINEEGEPIQLTTTLENGVLQVTMESDELDYISQYRLSPDGSRLTIFVNMEVAQLDKPVSYSLVYTRD